MDDLKCKKCNKVIGVWYEGDGYSDWAYIIILCLECGRRTDCECENLQQKSNKTSNLT